MDFVKFTLSGNSAFFKNPEVNAHFYFTFGNIHKVALLGMFGAILGYGGYGQMSKSDLFPEFYQRLEHIKVAIVPPEKSKGYISKKIQSFNNSVGYASEEQGGNLVIKQQWLEKPLWDIYFKVEDIETEKLRDMLLQKSCVYMPYLGSNDHPADIKNVEIVQGNLQADVDGTRVHSLFPVKQIQLQTEDYLELVPFRYEEYLPIVLERETILYRLEKFMYTNLLVCKCSDEIYKIKDRNIFFF